MKPIVKTVLLVLLLSTGSIVQVTAQAVKSVVIKATNPADDSKSNSDSIPDVIPIYGEFDRILVLRFKYKTDLLNGLREMASEENIQNGVILSGIGSVRNYHIHSVSNNEFPSENIYIKDPDAPADLASINGYIIDGRVHAHVVLTDENGAFGGHLEEGTSIFTFAIVTIGVFKDGIDLSKVDDKTYR
jgi:predicted DNA-binding protein with PD1-like motif